MIHIRHYITNCSIGDWFVLYQMSKNLNKRFFAEFLALLALTVDPDPEIEPEDPEICLSEKDIERHRNGPIEKKSSDSSSEDDDDDDEDDEEGGKKNLFANLEGDIDMELSTDGPGGQLSGKQRMLIKQGKSAMSAKHKAMKAMQAMRKMKRR